MKKTDPNTQIIPARIDRFTKTYTLWKEFAFEACHSLTKLPRWHQCTRRHGHSYRVRIHCSGPPVKGYDWLVDYGEVSSIVKPFIDLLDHQCLNDILKDGEQGKGRPLETTAENLAYWFAIRISRRLPELSAVEILETATSSVTLHLK